VHHSGIHATVAGVLLAFTVPARALIDPDAFADHATAAISVFRGASGHQPVLCNELQQRALASLEEAAEDALPPLARMLQALHVPVNFVIMPLFALANAGISLDGMGLDSIGAISLGVIAGLVVGKPLGILLFTAAAVKLGARLPSGVRWGQIAGVACLAGIGFTMSLFVSSLAFPSPAMLVEAKLGIFVASLVAGLLGALVITVASRPTARTFPADGAAG
jgi:NhaA family Na+:H+ antiporter